MTEHLPDFMRDEINAALAQDAAEQAEADAYNAAALRARDVQTALYRMEVQEEARRKKNAQERANLERPQLVTLPDLLQRQYETPTYRLDGLWPTGGRMLLAAQWKAGKSTLVGNLVRALVDGDPFLGRFTPRQAHKVILIDDELDERTLQLWFREQHITNTDRVTLLPLRGRVAAFDILDPDSRAEWAKDLHGHDVALLDCLRPIFDAFGLDENHEAGRFLVALDALLLDADVQECGVVHHMGHTNERSRGDSRLLDWPDALWKIVRDKDEEDEAGHADDPTGSRYFSAYGRDVEFPQTELLYTPADRRLELGVKTRQQVAGHKRQVNAETAVIAVVEAQPGITKRSLAAAAAARGATHKPDLDEAVERLVEDGVIRREVKGQKHHHYPVANPHNPGTVPTVPNRPQNQLGTVPSPTVPKPSPTKPRDSPAADCPQSPLGAGTPATESPTQPPTVPNTKTGDSCPHCDFNQLPPGATMCDECAERFELEAMPGD